MIRPAKPQDAHGVGAVLAASYNIDDAKEGADVFATETAKGVRYLVAVDGEDIIGIATWYPHGLPKHGLAELDRIAVLEKAKGTGVSGELFDGLVADAKAWYEKNESALRKLYLLTHDDNDRAHRFYEKMGFAHETTLKNHYYDGKDERVYSQFF